MKSIGKINEGESFSRRLKELRGSASKAAFARSIGVSAPLYQKYEQGRIPSADKLMLISSALGVSTDWLLGRERGTSVKEVAEAVDTTRDPEGREEEDHVKRQVVELIERLYPKAESARRRIINQIINRLEEYDAFCEEHYAGLRSTVKEEASNIYSANQKKKEQEE